MQRTRHRPPLWLLVWTLALSTHAAPAGPAESTEPMLSKAPNLGVFVTHGFAHGINGSAVVDYDGMGLRASFPVGAKRSAPRSSVAVEVLPAVWFSDQRDPAAGGFHVLYELRYANRRGVTPVLRAGAGMLLANREVPAGGTHHNFSLFGGAGVDLALGPRRALALEYRFHHISNANTGEYNPGINAHALLAALTFTLEP